MTAITHRDAESYLAKQDHSHFLYLVFGADQGLVIERSRKLLARSSADALDSPKVIDFSGDSIAADPLALIDELHSIGLFDVGPRPIRVELGSRSILPALEMVVRTPPTNRIIVILASELKRDAPLRKWFEKQDSAVSIECHPDQPRDIQSLLDAEFTAAHVSIEPDARDLLIGRLGEDRLLTRTEIEKLLLYIKGEEAISIDHITDILLDASSIDINTLISDGFSGKLTPIIVTSNKLAIRPNDYSRLGMGTLRYALSIHRANADLGSGAAFDAALQDFLRFINGYNRKRDAAAQLQKISIEKSAALIDALYITIKKERQNSILNEEQLSRLLIAFVRSLKGAKTRVG